MVSCKRFPGEASEVLVLIFGDGRTVTSRNYPFLVRSTAVLARSRMTLPSFNEMDGSGVRGSGMWAKAVLAFAHGHLLPPQFPSKVPLAESDRNQTSFIFNVASTSENGIMLPTRSQLLPSRRDDRVILHFDCRYTALHGTIYNMQLADPYRPKMTAFTLRSLKLRTQP